MAIELLALAVEIGIVTTNLDAMVVPYEGCLGLPTRVNSTSGGTMKRYTLGANVLKLVTLDNPPAAPAAPGGGPAQAGIRYVTVVVKNVKAAEKHIADAGYDIVQPAAEFAPGPRHGLDVRRRPGWQLDRTGRPAGLSRPRQPGTPLAWRRWPTFIPVSRSWLHCSAPGRDAGPGTTPPSTTSAIWRK